MAQNILLIQDDKKSATAVGAALTNSSDPIFHVEWVRTCAHGVERLTLLGKQGRQRPLGIAAVLADLSLPDASGLEAFGRLFGAARQVPILVLSSEANEADAQMAVKRGAQDYLLEARLDDSLLPKALAGVIDRAANIEALLEEKERAEVTLNCIGDAVIGTNIEGNVTYLNRVAERLTGWPSADAVGRPLGDIFRIIDSESRATVPNSTAPANHEDEIEGLTPTCILIRRDGAEAAIEDSVAPIHDRYGQVIGAVIVFRDVSATRSLSLKLAHLAQHDSLTDLPNRALFNDRLTQAITLARRHHTSLAVLYLDLDRFKQINDSLGHAIGDRLLQSVAMRFSSCIRASDTVSRQGGDEFVILLSEVAHAQDAAVCADKVIHSLKMPFLLDEHELHVTASVGIVIYPEDGTEVAALLQNADSAMYEAKGRGRNNYQFFRLDLNSSANERQNLEGALRHAIQRHEFELHFQPIINLATGAIAGVEALLRWRHPTLGVVLPTQFIWIAEESGLIVPIGQWVLREACAQAQSWQVDGLPPLRLGVNISAVELRSPEFVPGVAAILAETGFSPRQLELELTETFLLQDSKSTALVVNALKGLGVQLALDDFGTGYSSLSYMRRFPIDALKVDRSFVRDLTTDADDASVVRAVVNMGSSFHMRVTAEGVETQEQLRFLGQNGCSEAQGYYFSPPLTAAGFADYCANALLAVVDDQVV
jgi:diguanylate cyclase (GGDEF)-like protein/PAS domain S-box-containing protein